MLTLSPSINVILIIDFLILIFLIISSVISLQIILKWNFNVTNTFQYNLEKKSYLSSTILKLIFTVKILLVFYFLSVADDLSVKLPGAMCAVGVFNSSQYGKYLLFTKIIVLFLMVLWLFLNHFDYKNINLPYTKLKSKLLLLIFVFYCFELFYELKFFYLLDPSKIVTCCSAVFNNNETNLNLTKFIIHPETSMVIFYVSYLFLLISYVFNRKKLYGLFCFIFFIFAIISLIYFFSSYIYELPSHKCPFCILQSDYYYIGYLLYLLLFSGCFIGMTFGILSFIIPDSPGKIGKIGFSLLTIYVLIITLYPLLYFLKNGVWL